VYATEKIADLECLLKLMVGTVSIIKKGNDLPIGIYIYEVYFQDSQDSQDFEAWKNQDSGHLFIIR